MMVTTTKRDEILRKGKFELEEKADERKLCSVVSQRLLVVNKVILCLLQILFITIAEDQLN